MDTTAVYVIGDVRNLHQILLELFPPGCISSVVTSPPYHQINGYSDRLMVSFGEQLHGLNYSGPLWVNFGDVACVPQRALMVPHLIALGIPEFQLIQTIIWYKNHRKPRQGFRTFDQTHEYIFYMADPRHPPKLLRKGQFVGIPYKDKSNVGRYSDVDCHCPGTVWNIDYENIRRRSDLPHPHRFPVGLPLRCISATMVPESEGYVLDPFAGSGTTMVAAHRLGIMSIGIDNTETWIDVVKERLGQDVDVVRWSAECR